MDLTEKCLQKSRFYQTTGSAVFLQMLTFFQLTRAGDGVFQLLGLVMAFSNLLGLVMAFSNIFRLVMAFFQLTEAGDGVFPT